MTVPALAEDIVAGRVDALLRSRTTENAAFFQANAEPLARLCHCMAERFVDGGRLVAVGASPAARSDVRHVAVEFVHPVIVGKRALPAIGITLDGGSIEQQVDLVVEPHDILVAFGDAGDPHAAVLRAALALGRRRGALTVAFAPSGAEWELVPPGSDPFVNQELVETAYHVLWELVHVFFEHRALLDARHGTARPDVGGSSFLYPFLANAETDVNAVLADVRRSALMKAAETAALREQTLIGGRAALGAAAAALRKVFDADGVLLALGNGGSATDAMDVVADFRMPPPGTGWPARRALDLTEDSAILTALANDIGPDVLFARQVIAYGRAGDAVLAFSTSGSSRNVILALEEARRRALVTIAFVGYDGGRILAEGLATHVIVTPSQFVPRIQEAQASAYHVLRELVEDERP